MPDQRRPDAYVELDCPQSLEVLDLLKIIGLVEAASV